VTAAELCRLLLEGLCVPGAARGRADRMVGFDPTPEQEALREMVHKFAANEIRPRAAEWDRDGVFHWSCSGRRSTWG